MSFGQSLRVSAIEVQAVAYTDITSSFVAMGDGMDKPIRILKVNNTTDSDIYISFDGVTAHDVVVASTAMVIDITANKSTDPGIFIAEGTIVYIEYVDTVPTYGTVYLSAYYSYNN